MDLPSQFCVDAVSSRPTQKDDQKHCQIQKRFFFLGKGVVAVHDECRDTHGYDCLLYTSDAADE